MTLIRKKQALQRVKKVVEDDLKRHQQNLKNVKKMTQESRFAEAIQLCDEVIAETDPSSDDKQHHTILMQLKLNQQFNERFKVIRNVRLVNCLQNTMSNIFKKQSSFDTQQNLYAQTIGGFVRLFPNSADQIILDIKMRLKDATRCKVNFALLRFATETNCKWLTRLCVTPANYLKHNTVMTVEYLTADTVPNDSSDFRNRSGVNSAINLSTDQLVRMID